MPSPTAFKCTQCPDGWLHVGDKCFSLYTDRDNFLNSTIKCAENGAHLAILTTKEQHVSVSVFVSVFEHICQFKVLTINTFLGCRGTRRQKDRNFIQILLYRTDWQWEGRRVEMGGQVSTYNPVCIKKRLKNTLLIVTLYTVSTINTKSK